MLNNKKVLVIAVLLIAFLFSFSFSDNVKKFDLHNFEGNWKGKGEFLIPATSISMSIDGQAEFRYDTTNGYLRTALTGEKFLFTYSDSGHLSLDEQTDSVYWEVWDNFGKHAQYKGVIDGNIIRGSRYRKNSQYSVMIEMITRDSIEFKLIIAKPNGKTIEKATFHLWRVKD